MCAYFKKLQLGPVFSQNWIPDLSFEIFLLFETLASFVLRPTLGMQHSEPRRLQNPITEDV